MKKSYFYIRYAVFVILFAIVGTVTFRLESKKISAVGGDIEVSENTETKYEIVIDAGHGGEDGGAAVGDVIEKNLNLSISEKLNTLLQLFGYRSLMTRTDDRLLYDYYNELENYTGHKKSYDLKNRIRIATDAEASLYVGIHMNNFSDSKYFGMQVYYSPNTSQSETAAEIIKSYNKEYLSPENKREIKKATQSIYILDRIQLPAVLVECGFLSNDSEREKLCTEEYQNAISAVLFASCAEFLS